MEKNTRSLDHIGDKEQKLHVVAKYLMDKELKIHSPIGDQQCFIREVIKGTDHIVLETFNASELKADTKIKIYTILTRYLELTCHFIKELEGNRVELKIDKISIAKKERGALRFPVVEEGFLKIGNIVSSKTIIEANMFNIPTLVRVSFEEYQRKLSQELGANAHVSVSIFGNNLDHEYDVIKKLMKPIFIADCYAESSYEDEDPVFINYSDEVDDHLATAIKKHKDKQIQSSLLLPILYINELDETIPIGYVSIQTKESRLTKDKVMEIIRQTNQMVERIKDANLMTTEDRFSVIDISTSGLRIKINHPNLNLTLPKQKGFVFDLFFKMQAPFRFTVKVAWSKLTDEGELLLGLELIGKARTLAERQRFEENVELIRQLSLNAA